MLNKLEVKFERATIGDLVLPKIQTEKNNRCTCGETKTEIKFSDCSQYVVCVNCHKIRFRFAF